MAVPKTPAAIINEWAERIVVALHDQEAWFRRGMTHGEIQTLSGLNAMQVSRGLWHGRLHGLLHFQREPGPASYTLTPLGVAIGRRLKASAGEMVSVLRPRTRGSEA